MDYFSLESYLQELAVQNRNWEEINQELNPESRLVNGAEVYCFYSTMDQMYQLLEESIAITVQPHHTFVPLHMHNYVELTYVYKGKVKLWINEGIINLSEGTIIIINKYTPHQIYETGPDDLVINIAMKDEYFTPAFLSRLSSVGIISDFLVHSLIKERSDNHYLLLEHPSRLVLKHIMEQLMSEFFQKKLFHQPIIDSYMVIVFSELMRFSEQQKRAPYTTKGETSLISFLQYIETHYKQCTLSQMANHFNFHPNYLSALLKQGTGKTFKELLQLQKINKASTLLAFSDIPISEIVTEIGYSSITFFYKKFKEIYKQTPSDYRKEKQQ